MKNVRKQYATLLEVLIAIALTVIIMMTLTYFYQQVSQIGSELNRISAANFSMRYVENRLAEVLPKSISESDKRKDFVFFSIGDEGLTKPGSQSLIFTFDNQVSLDKEFSNHVIGRLFLDKNGSLVLAYWPSPKRWSQTGLPPMKKEILMEGVDQLAFEFFVTPAPAKIEDKPANGKEEEKKKSKETKTSPEPQGEWRLQPWLQEFQQLPAMIKVVVTLPKSSKPLVFAFPLPNAKTHIIYE